MIQPDEIIRSRRKTLAITIDVFGRLIVRAPYACAQDRIFSFLKEKERWILRKKAERTGVGIRLPSENLDGYKFLLLGKECEICLTDAARVVYEKETGRIFLPKKNAKERLTRWLKDNAKRILTKVTQEKAAEMGAIYRSVSVNSAKSHWGVCSGENSIRYSFRLLYVPKEIIEYVVVHELAHTKYKNHSKLFWAEVDRYVAGRKEKRKWLKIHGGLMEIF